ncbi:phosphoserine phosphatase SerB [Leptospira noguchii]|uniref:Phosphoserine phosphatase n=2 Tax=Leptospira noguchii TaxID=28182 RepID=M6Y8L1_9LEPT|nr:phosphoserine phosphatase SerB [Leptospira noguchii]EMO90075.1 phosphoserine phosphatase SerB [Leptospira noguchii str. 2001034031]TQE81741.1 phosphoserine phosphatase SerB [Leptospira noguchii]UOG32069.1 phosphoserine phosphatase SerB [Leptospira noguchii]UOG35673.1 phosphoserine phosphatase SerB [Leptospira noguchii]UOG46604.1 phosphoserine phosphatase SerB [Leptospira noguchii]
MLLILTEKPEEIRKEILLGMGNFVSLKPEETFLLSSSKIRSRGFWNCIEWKIPRVLERSELLQWRETFSKKGADLIQVNRLLDSKEKSFFAFDMDSTLIRQEVIDELARLAGVYEEVASVTKEAMEGNLDFHEALKKRCIHLKGLSNSIFTDLYPKLELNTGVERLLKVLKENNTRTAVFSGGFTDILEMFQKQYGIDEVYANVLEKINGELSGNILGEIVDKNKKLEYLKMIRDREKIHPYQVVAIGDGANDSLMLNEAGIGIGFHAKEGLKKQILNWIDFAPMDVLLFLFP